MLATTGHLQLVLVTEGVVADYAVIPVLIPCAVGISTHLTGSGVNKGVPSVVLEGIVLLATELAAQVGAGDSLSIAPTITVVESLVAQGLVNQLYKLLLINVLVTLGSA